MGAVELLQELETLGVSVSVDGDEMVLRPGARVPSEMMGPLRQAKEKIMAMLTYIPDYSITACTCPQPIGPTGPERCQACGLPLLCPNCPGCRGCKLAVTFGRHGKRPGDDFFQSGGGKGQWHNKP